jgi:hypothetical protein
MATPSEHDPICKKFFSSALDVKLEPTLMKNMYEIEDTEGKVEDAISFTLSRIDAEKY